jgi:hypothetical protein
MDRDIVDIRLEVQSKDFDAEVTPSSSWRNYPYLKTNKRGGQKEYFEVELQRKKSTSQGKYKIGLHLFNGRDKSMVFKTVDIGEAMATKKIPECKTVPVIDGKASRKEWGKSLLCSCFHEYKKRDRYYENTCTSIGTRFRFVHDKKNLYCLIDFQKDSGNDSAGIFISKDYNSKPMEIAANLQSGKASINGKFDDRIKVIKDGNRMELAIPLDLLGIDGQKSFYANLTRNQGKTWTFWRGNPLSMEDPVVYANFVLN